jgi:hypothetical protein
MSQIHLPGWLYERLPHAYVTSGFSAVFALEHLAAYVSGGLLVLAGVLVWKVRRDFRRDGMASDWVQGARQPPGA